MKIIKEPAVLISVAAFNILLFILAILMLIYGKIIAGVLLFIVLLMGSIFVVINYLEMRKELVQNIADEIMGSLKEVGLKQFQLYEFMGYGKKALLGASEEVYERCVIKALRDYVITETENKVLDILRKRLGLSEKQTELIEERAKQKKYQNEIESRQANGVISKKEESELQELRAMLGLPEEYAVTATIDEIKAMLIVPEKREKAKEEKRPMKAVLIANVILVVGVLFLRWDVFTVVSIYWAETVIIGFYFVLKVMYAPRIIIDLITKIYVLMIFSFFFSVAVTMHGLVLVCIFSSFTSGDKSGSGGIAGFPINDYIASTWPGILGFFQSGIGAVQVMYHVIPRVAFVIPILCLVLGYGSSFFTKYIMNGERNRTTLNKLLSEPFNRIISIHLSLAVGFMLFFVFGVNFFMAICLIAFKYWLEVRCAANPYGIDFVKE